MTIRITQQAVIRNPSWRMPRNPSWLEFKKTSETKTSRKTRTASPISSRSKTSRPTSSFSFSLARPMSARQHHFELADRAGRQLRHRRDEVGFLAHEVSGLGPAEAEHGVDLALHQDRHQERDEQL